MYGLVHRAIHDLAAKHADPATWARIKARAGLEEDVFLSMESYPDEVTLALVVAAAAELGTSVDALLEQFGEHWISYAAEHGYRDLLHARGDSLFAFVARLDDLHARLSLIFPKLRPPSFKAEVLDERTMRVFYSSERSGLAPFVTGLIRGLGKLFATPVRVALHKRREDASGHDEFLVTTV